MGGQENGPSAVIIGTTGAPAATVTADHPFLFAIVDKTGSVLFAGQVMDPRG
jgi:serpin B